MSNQLTNMKESIETNNLPIQVSLHSWIVVEGVHLGKTMWQAPHLIISVLVQLVFIAWAILMVILIYSSVVFKPNRLFGKVVNGMTSEQSSGTSLLQVSLLQGKNNELGSDLNQYKRLRRWITISVHLKSHYSSHSHHIPTRNQYSLHQDIQIHQLHILMEEE